MERFFRSHSVRLCRDIWLSERGARGPGPGSCGRDVGMLQPARLLRNPRHATCCRRRACMRTPHEHKTVVAVVRAVGGDRGRQQWRAAAGGSLARCPQDSPMVPTPGTAAAAAAATLQTSRGCRLMVMIGNGHTQRPSGTYLYRCVFIFIFFFFHSIFINIHL